MGAGSEAQRISRAGGEELLSHLPFHVKPARPDHGAALKYLAVRREANRQ